MESKDDFFRKLRENFSSGGKKVEISELPASMDAPSSCPICRGSSAPRPITTRSGKRVGYKCVNGVVHVAVDFRIGSANTHIVWSGTYDVVDIEYAEQQVEIKSGETLSSEEIENRFDEIRKQVTTLIDDWLSLRAADAKKRLCNPQDVDRTTLWRRISEEYQQAAWISSIEIFTASAGLDCFTQEWPQDSEGTNDIDPMQINEEHAKGALSFRDVSGRYCYLLTFNERALAIVRVQHETDKKDLEKERNRLEKLSFALADTLDYRRRLRAQENIRRIQIAGITTADADRSGCLQKALQICSELLECASAELIIRPQESTVSAPLLLPVFLRDPEFHTDLPWKHPTDDPAIVNAMKTAKTAFVKRGSAKDLDAECGALSECYPQTIVDAYRSYRCDIQSTISIPLTFGNEIIAFCSFNRTTPLPFYLGLVHVVEIILEYVASYVRDVQLALTNHKQAVKEDIASQTGLSTSPVNRERQRLCFEIIQTATSRTGATRAAVALFAEKKDELAIVGPRVPSAISNWPADYFEIRIKPDRPDSAVAAAIESKSNYLIDDRQEKSVRYFSPERDVCKIISSANILMMVGNSNVIGVLIVEWEAANRASLHEPELQRIADEYAYRIHALEVHSRTTEIAASLQRVNNRVQLPAALDACTEKLADMIGPGNYHFYLRDRNTGAFRQVGLAAPPASLLDGTDVCSQSLLLLLGLLAPASYCAVPKSLNGRFTRRHERKVASNEVFEADWAVSDRVDPELLLQAEIAKLGSSELVQGLIQDAMFTPIRLGPQLTADEYRNCPTGPRAVLSRIPQAAVFGMLISTAANGDGEEDSYDLVDKQAAETVADTIRDRLDLLDEQTLSKAYRCLVDICFGTAVYGNQSANGSYIASKTFDCLHDALGDLGAHVRLIDGNHHCELAAVRIAYRRPDWLKTEESFGPLRVQPAGADAAGWVYEHKQTFYDPDCNRVDSPCRQVGTPESFVSKVGSVLVTPLRGGHKIIGTLHIYKAFAYAFSPREIRFISEAVAPLLASAVQTADLLCGNRLREGIRRDVEQLKFRLEESLEQGYEPAVDDECLKTFFEHTSVTFRKELGVASVFALVVDETELQLWRSVPGEDTESEWVHDMQTNLDVFDDLNITGLKYCFVQSPAIAPICKWLTSNFPDPELRKQFCSLCGNELSIFFSALKVDGRAIVLFFEPAVDFPLISGTVETLVIEYAKRSEEMETFLEQSRWRLSERRREEGKVAPLVMMGAALSHFEHALRFPLANLKSALRYLSVRKNAADVSEVLEATRDMQAEVSHLESFVDRMLKAARALDESAFTAFSLKDVFVDSLQTLTRVTWLDAPARQAGGDDLLLHLPDNTTIPVILAIDPTLPRVKGSPRGLTVAFSFLLGNAIEAIKTVREKDRDGSRRIRIFADRLSPRSDRISVTIADDGIGMTPELTSRVDQPFVSTKATGTGLGLTCAKYIIRRHGCEIILDSECYPKQPSGTAISFFLPTATQD